MNIPGWRDIPRGYGLQIHEDEAPVWLRLWLHTPIVDRFAYPVAVRHGVARLNPAPGWSDKERDPVPEGWRVDPG